MTDTSAIDALLGRARAILGPRPAPADLDSIIRSGGLIVDIRPSHLRERDGDLPGAVVIDRNVLEWRLDPTSPHRIAGVENPARIVVIVCDEGYASTLAAVTLRELGLANATDLDGGFRAWIGHHGRRDP